MKLSIAQIADMVKGSVVGDDRPMIAGVAPFEAAAPDRITFAGHPKFLKKMDETGAGAVIVPRGFKGSSEKPLICADHPQLAFLQVVRWFHPHHRPPSGISPHAGIGVDFACGKDVSIGHFVVIGDHVRIGDRTVLHPGVFVGDGASIGDDVEIYPHVTVRENCVIGNRVIIHASTVIGSDGFGFVPTAEGYHKIPHIGIVQIDDDVEIGAANTIDRATFGKTWIQRGVKTDNLVHVAHNVTVGEHTALVAQVGISGSTTIGRHAVLAGQAGISGHITIGDHVTVGPQAGVARSVESGQIVSGSPEMPHSQWLRVQHVVPRLPELSKKIAELEKRLRNLEAGQGCGVQKDLD